LLKGVLNSCWASRGSNSHHLKAVREETTHATNCASGPATYFGMVLGQFGPGQFGPGQFGPGQFGTRTIRTRTIRYQDNSVLGQFGPGQFGPEMTITKKNKNRKNMKFDFSFCSAYSGSFMWIWTLMTFFLEYIFYQIFIIIIISFVLPP